MSRQETQPTGFSRQYRDDFSSFERSLNGGKNLPIHAMRRHALEQLDTMGFPAAKDEEWRFTDPSPILRKEFRFRSGEPAATPDAAEVDRYRLPGDAIQLVFVDGIFSPLLSAVQNLPAGIVAGSLAGALQHHPAQVEEHLARLARAEDHPFAALNTAFLRDGGYVRVPDGVVLEIPIHLLFLTTARPGMPAVQYPRVLIVTGRGSQCSVVEQYAGLGTEPYLTSALTECVIGEQSTVEHTRLQRESPEAYHIGLFSAHQGRNSTLMSNHIALGGALARTEINAVLGGEGAETNLSGLYIGAGAQHHDNRTVIDHAMPNCSSHELYKGILAGSGHGVFNGKIKVRKDAQKTDARQTNKNLILSDGAVVDTKPQLEIFANDVKCTHGATIGRLDDDALFYLRSRGIGLGDARVILIGAFASDVTGRIRVTRVRELVDAAVRRRLEQVTGEGMEA